MPLLCSGGIVEDGSANLVEGSGPRTHRNRTPKPGLLPYREPDDGFEHGYRAESCLFGTNKGDPRSMGLWSTDRTECVYDRMEGVGGGPTDCIANAGRRSFSRGFDKPIRQEVAMEGALAVEASVAIQAKGLLMILQGTMAGH